MRCLCRIVCLLMLVLIACAENAAEPIHIEVPLQDGGEGVEIFQTIARQYERVRPGVKVDLYADPRIADKLRVRILEKNFPQVTNGDIGNWNLIRHDDILDLAPYLAGPNWEGDGVWRDSFIPGTLDRYTEAGHCYGLPLSYYAQGIWYNKKLFREHGWSTPATWERLLSLCEQIQQSGIAPMAFQGRYVYYAQAIVDSAYYQLAGIDAFKRQKNLEPGSFDNPELVQALAWTQQLATRYFQPGAMGMGHTEAQLQFFLGNAAMIPCGSWLKSEMAGKIPDGFELGVFNFPAAPQAARKGDPTALYAFSGFYVIFANAPHREQAVDFLRFLTSRQVASLFCRQRDLPVAIKGVNESNLSPDLQDLATMIRTAKTSYGEQQGEGFPLMGQEWNDVLVPVLTGRVSPQEAAKDLEQRAAHVRQLTLDPDSMPIRHSAKPIALIVVMVSMLLFAGGSSLRRWRLRGSRSQSSLTREAASDTHRMSIRHVLLFVGPSLALFVLFVLVPAIKSFSWSTRQWDGLTDMHWAGMRHFRHLLFEDDGFWIALRNNLYIMLVIPAFVVPMSLFLAACISRSVRGARIFRVIFLFPSVMGGVAATLLWMHLYDPQGGIINSGLVLAGNALTSIHLGFAGRVLQSFSNFAWLSQDHLYTALVPMSVWAGFGFNLVLYLAAMEGIPPDLYEAAEIDGASPLQQFRTITLPLIWDVLSISTVFMIIGGMKAFETIWLLTNQTPGTETHVIGTRMVQAMFSEMNVGEATAIAVILFFMVFATSVFALRAMKRETVEM